MKKVAQQFSKKKIKLSLKPLVDSYLRKKTIFRY